MAKYHDDYVPSPVSSSTPKIRAAIQASKSVTSTLSERYGISELTVAKGQKPDNLDEIRAIFLSFSYDVIAYSKICSHSL
ncbi:MAG: hypothetical protein ACTS85_04960 [Arsenophonus sp. NC-PG7-MAG3]